MKNTLLAALSLIVCAGIVSAEELSPKTETAQPKPTSPLYSTAVANEGGYVAINRDGKLTHATLKGETRQISEARLLPKPVALRNGNALVCDGEKIHEVNLKTGETLRSVSHIGGPVGYVNDDRIFALTGGTVDFIDFKSGEVVSQAELFRSPKENRYSNTPGQLHQLCVSGDTLYAAGMRGPYVCAIDLKTGEKIKEFKSVEKHVYGIQASGENLFLLTGLQGYGVVYFSLELVDLKTDKTKSIKLPRMEKYQFHSHGYLANLTAEPGGGIAMIVDGMLLRYDAAGKLISKKESAIEPLWQLIASNGKQATVSTLTGLKQISVE